MGNQGVVLLVIVSFAGTQSWAQEPEPTPSEAVIAPATAGGVVAATTPEPPAWPTARDSILLHIEQNASIDAFIADQGELEASVRTGTLADAWVKSGSVLYTWANYIDYLGMLETLEELYGQLSAEEVGDAYDIRLGMLSGESRDCFACMDAGLMALSVGRMGDAERCFRRAADAEFYRGNPFPRVMIARALLKQGRLEAATAEYEAAIGMVEEASGDPSLLFRFRYTQIKDLFNHGYVEESWEKQAACLESEYWPERVWAVCRSLYYHWSKNQMELVEALTDELEFLLTIAEARPDVLWENKRVRHAEKALERVRGALGGDPVKQLIMDEESLEWEWEAKNYQAVVDRLKGWVERYPITAYGNWDPELQEWGSWVHWTYHIALCNTGHPEEAGDGLQALIDNMPFEHSPLRLVNAWCWLGHCLGRQERYAEAVAAMETGLSLDVAHIDTELSGVPIGFDQPRVRGGVVKGEWRPGYVAAYQKLLKWRALGDEFERLQREEGQ